MKKVSKIAENCISTPSSCTYWTGGDIKSLGICDGDPINEVILDIVKKLEDIVGQDLSSFDLDSLLSICKQSLPLEVDLVSILTIIKENQVCLKDYIDALNDKISSLSLSNKVEVNLRCYSDFDTLGNSLSITREQLDQLVVDELCDHKRRLNTVEGKITTLQNQINNIDINPVVDEPSFATCLNPSTLSTSAQTKSVAEALCDMRISIGLPAQVAQALSKVPNTWNTKYSLLQGWDLSTDNWAQQYGNALLVIANLEERLAFMEENCCSSDCDDVKLGFFVTMSEDGTSAIIQFTSGAGTKIPTGFVDKGSTGVITDEDGLSQSFNIVIGNNAELEVPITGLRTTGKLQIDINAKLGNANLSCDKCLNKSIQLKQGCCVITNTSTTDNTIIYESTI